MAIHKKQNANGTEFFYVYVVAKSKKDRSLKVQKEQNNIASHKDAERIEKRLKNEVKEELLRREFDGETWGALTKKWEQELLSGKATQKPISINTAKDYIFLVKEYTKAWNKTPISKILPADISLLYKTLTTDDGKSNSTAKRMRSTLNCVFHWAAMNRKVSTNPVKGIAVNYNSEETKPEILKLSEIHSLLESASVLGHEWFEVWTVALLTGMRNGELYALKWDKVDFENNLINVESNYNTKTRSYGPTKGRYWRSVPINDVLFKFLTELKKKTGNTSFVLPRCKDWEKGYQAKVLRAFCSSIGITPVKFHTLRACFATHLLCAGVPPAQVQKIGGWRDSKTMDKYVRLAGTDVKNATKNMPILPPLIVMDKVVDFLPKKTV